MSRNSAPINGVTGQDGAYLSQLLLEKGGVDPRCFGLPDVELLIGDPTKALERPGCKHTTLVGELAAEMGREDMEGHAELANSEGRVMFNLALYQNLVIETNLIEAARRADVGRLLFLGSSCIYPEFAEQPIQEESLLTGALEPTNEWYAIVKIAGIKLCQAYRKQNGCDYTAGMPTNLYGPSDNFDLQSSHLTPALMRKAHEAKQCNDTSITIWELVRCVVSSYMSMIAPVHVFICSRHAAMKATLTSVQTMTCQFTILQSLCAKLLGLKVISNVMKQSLMALRES